ncbi:hypothetical protein BRY73_05930 [Ochrobactrum sp. P6BS-III]|nr:hypothetical protein BRY73_05930 [Ochrobactrum sp. P6BS-III]
MLFPLLGRGLPPVIDLKPLERVSIGIIGSAFQLFVFKHILPENRFTLFGMCCCCCLNGAAAILTK